MSAMPPRRPGNPGAGPSSDGPAPAGKSGNPLVPAPVADDSAGTDRTPAGLDPDMDAAMAPFLEAAAEDRSLERFRTLFAGRADAFARQWADRKTNRQGYRPERRALTDADLRAHLDGTATLGIYLLDAESRVRTAVLDADLVPELRGRKPRHDERGRIRAELNFLARRVRELGRERGVSPVIEFSGGKGYHFWFLFSRPVPAAEARRLVGAVAGAVSRDLTAFSLEVFPKQDRLSGKGLGNLVKLPLGIHRISGRRSWFAQCADRSADAQLRWLADVEPADPDRVDFHGPEGGGSGRETGKPETPARSRSGKPPTRAGNGGGSSAKGPTISLPAVYPPPEPGDGPATGRTGESPEESAEESPMDRNVSTPPLRPGPRTAAPMRAVPAPSDPVSVATPLERLTAACPPLARAAGECRSGTGLSEAGERVLFQTLAFLPEGPEILHRLMAEVPDTAPREVEFRLGRVRGTPLGCRRIHALTGYRGDFCAFAATDDYAHPLRHLEMESPGPVHERAADLESALRNLKAAIAAVEGILR